MTEKCKHCGKEMKFIKERKEDGYRIYRYECRNEDCLDGGYKEYHVCENCESEFVIEE